MFSITNTYNQGGLLAIMLGRLRMTIDQCEEAFVDMSEKIFTPRRSQGNFVGQGLDFVNARGKFSTETLEACVKDVVRSRELSEDELFYKQGNDGCKV
jgi:hypothetical protein